MFALFSYSSYPAGGAKDLVRSGFGTKNEALKFYKDAWNNRGVGYPVVYEQFQVVNLKTMDIVAEGRYVELTK